MRTWKPDTCECVVEELYNGTEIIGGGQVVKKCPAHESVPDNELYGVLYSNPDGENKVKNMVYRALLGHDEVKGLGIEEEKENADGSVGIVLKKGIEYVWSFTGTGKNRVLSVEVKGANLSNAHKASIKSHCDSKFGVGKVVI